MILGVRLLSVYPPTLRRDPATIALQACRILDGERPVFYSGQAWMGAAGTYVEAFLFQLFGKNSLVMSMYAWACSGAWIFFSLLLAWRFFGPRAAIYSAVIWLVPTSALRYWSSQARNDYHALFIATPVILLLTHDIVRRFRGRENVAARMAFLGFVGGFSFWQNMAIGPCLVVTFAVLALHLGLLFFHVLVLTVTPFARGFMKPGNPILYMTNLYCVAFVIPAVVLASRSRSARLLMALPFLIYFGNNLKNTLSYPQAFFSALREKGAAAIDRFPDLEDPLIKTLLSKNLSQGYLESWRAPVLNLLGLHYVEFSSPYHDRVVEYSLRADAAKEIFWVGQRGLPEGFRMIGSRHETSQEPNSAKGVFRASAGKAPPPPVYSRLFSSSPAERRPDLVPALIEPQWTEPGRRAGSSSPGRAAE